MNLAKTKVLSIAKDSNKLIIRTSTERSVLGIRLPPEIRTFVSYGGGWAEFPRETFLPESLIAFLDWWTTNFKDTF